MTETELTALAAELGKKNADSMKAMFDAARVEDAKSVADLQAKLMNDLGADSAHIKAMQAQLDAISTELKTKNDKREITKSFRETLASANVADKLKNLRETRTGFTLEVPLTVKIAADMLNSTHVSSGLPKPTWIPGVSKAPDETPFLAQLVPTVATTSNTVYYVNRTTRNNGAAAQTEGSALGRSDFLYAGASASIADIGTFTKISDNMLGDNDFVAGQLNAELPWEVLHAQDAAILTGILSGATAFSAAAKGYLNNVVDANYFDVLRAAVNQARASNFQPDVILVNNDDYTMMELSKTAQGVYAMPPFYGAGLTISGVRCIPNNTITSGTFCVCTLNRTFLAIRENMVMEFGYDADDFTKRLITARAYVRSAFIKSTYANGGFITGTFAAGVAALTL